MSGARGATRRPRVAIVMGRCQQRGGVFGVRFQQTGSGSGESRWDATWAFPMAESAARREGYDRTTLSGTFTFTDAYPGCPWCEAPGIVHCGHQPEHVACWDGRTETVRCPWCERTSTIDGAIDSLHSGGDR